MKLSFIIPIYNEVDLIEVVLERVRALPIEKELILVDDCSTDGTAEILKKEALKPDTRVITHTENRGKGASIRTGLKHATGDIVIIQDADLEYNPEEIPAVIQPIVDGRTRVAYGSRFLGEVKRMRLPNYVANKVLAFLVTILYGQKITDEATAYKAFRREVRSTVEARGPLALRLAKEAVTRAFDLPLDDGLRLEHDLYVLLQTTVDRREGVRAFLGRRKPRFRGR